MSTIVYRISLLLGWVQSVLLGLSQDSAFWQEWWLTI
jgi:hypothetical protein